MKTISSLIREIFSLRNNPHKPKPTERAPEEMKSKTQQHESENQRHQKQDETETDEIRRDPEMDSAVAREIAGNAESSQGADRGKSGEPKPGSEEIEMTRMQKETSPAESEKSLAEKEIEKAFQQGVIAGRNQKIEEKFFPQSDGLPVFHGMPAKGASSIDIFSLAREA